MRILTLASQHLSDGLGERLANLNVQTHSVIADTRLSHSRTNGEPEDANSFRERRT